jgi:hypothetical protein
MSALTLAIVLAFAAILVAMLAAWATLTLPTRIAAARRRAEEAAARPQPRTDLSNDAVRGDRAPRKRPPLDAIAPTGPDEAAVRVRPRSERRSGEDPFDRFLERGRKRDEF